MKVQWYINRLRKMPLPEIPWRLLEKAKKIRDSRRKFAPPQFKALPDPSIFSLSPDWHCLPPGAAPLLSRHRQTAHRAISNQFDAFGIPACITTPSDWHRDPVTRKQWPQKFWGEINIRQKDLGGVKFVWEVNRLYALLPLAISYRISGEKRYADHILRLIRSWIRGNPYPTGVNWASPIEAGVRLANLIWALSLLESYPFNPRDLESVNAFVFCHAAHLARYPSRYSSSNNHFLAESFGLFVAGLYFPHLPGAKQWRTSGKAHIEQEVLRQILPDGGSFEYSTTYLSFVFDFFLLFRYCCIKSNLSYPSGLDKRLARTCEFIHTLQTPHGTLPNIGDQDSAVLVNFGLTSRENLSSILNTGAVEYGRPEYARLLPDIKTWMLTGTIPQPVRETESSPPGCRARRFPYSGISVIHDRSSGALDVLFTGNATPMGLPPLYAHGHLDALSFTLSVNSQPFIVDPGTYLYHNSDPWRRFFRSTAAHNTIRIDQRELSEQPGDFMFGKPYGITRNKLERVNGNPQWTAGHDAYGYEIQRQVSWVPKKKCFFIKDRFKKNSGKKIELFFHFHPQCRIREESSQLIAETKDIAVELIYDSTLSADVRYGARSPIRGWYSPEFNRIVKTHTLILTGPMEEKTQITTCLKIRTGC